MLEPGCALATRVSAQRHTKAQVQPAKEGVLDSECEGAARRKLRRRCVDIPMHGVLSIWQFRTSLMDNQGQILRLLSGIWVDRGNSGSLPLNLAT